MSKKNNQKYEMTYFLDISLVRLFRNFVQSFLETEVKFFIAIHFLLSNLFFYCKVFTPFERWQRKWFISVEEFSDLWFWNNNGKLILDDWFSLGVDAVFPPWMRRLLNSHPKKSSSPKRADLSVCQVSICLMSL